MGSHVILQAQHLTSFWEKTIGLLNKSSPSSVYFEAMFGIHTFGMRYSIDIIILDKKNHVIKLHKNLKPNRLFFWNPYYKCVAELPQGTIDKHRIEKGTKVIIEFL